MNDELKNVDSRKHLKKQKMQILFSQRFCGYPSGLGSRTVP